MTTPTRLVYADELKPGDVIVDLERDTEHVVLRLRRHGADLISGIGVDRDGEQQELGFNTNTVVRVLVIDVPVAGQPAEDTPASPHRD